MIGKCTRQPETRSDKGFMLIDTMITDNEEDGRNEEIRKELFERVECEGEGGWGELGGGES